MSRPQDEQGLVSPEGVDEASAASTAEGAGTGAAGDVLGEPPRGAPVDDASQAAPDDMETAGSRAARRDLQPGQQLQQGEG